MSRPDDVASRQLSETLDADASASAEASVFVRPERLILRVGDAEGIDGPRVRGTIIDKSFSGAMTMVRVRVRDHVELTVTCDSASPEARDAVVGGDAVVTWLPSDATLLDR
jgi:hypothetical protein